MEILGIGTHIIECLRIAQMIERHGELFLQRVFTRDEIAYCSSRRFASQQYASHWAAKEAVLQALGAEWSGAIDWRDIEVRVQGRDRPRVALAGELQEHCASRGIGDILLSMAHCRTHATAYATAVSD